MEGDSSGIANESILAAIVPTARTFQPPLIETDPLIFYPYVSVTVLAMVVGVLGNGALLITLLVNKGLQKVGREFMINMCLADLCVTGIADPLCIVASIKGEQYLTERKSLCTAIAAVCLSACICAFLSLTNITMSRLVFICYNEMYNKLFSRKKAIFQCCLCWVVAFCMELGNFLGWGSHIYDRKNESCIWNRTASLSYTYFVGLFLISFPLLMMLISNIKIFANIRNTKANLAKVQHRSDQHPLSVWRETIKACRTLFLSFITFCGCWIPYTVVILIDFRDDTVSPLVHLFLTWLAHMHSAFIVFVYMSNREIRRTVLSTIFGRCCSRTSKSRAAPSNGQGGTGSGKGGASSGDGSAGQSSTLTNLATTVQTPEQTTNATRHEE